MKVVAFGVQFVLHNAAHTGAFDDTLGIVPKVHPQGMWNTLCFELGGN